MGVDALECSLEGVTEGYANPPWTVIGPWLARLRTNPQLKCMLITPMWDSVYWWPQLIKMQVPGTPAIVIPPYQGMF